MRSGVAPEWPRESPVAGESVVWGGWGRSQRVLVQWARVVAPTLPCMFQTCVCSAGHRPWGGTRTGRGWRGVGSAQVWKTGTRPSVCRTHRWSSRAAGAHSESRRLSLPCPLKREEPVAVGERAVT